MPSFGLSLMELLILAGCIGLPILALLITGLVFGLIRWGVIGAYWLKGEEPARQEGHYTLDQSAEVGKRTDR